MDFGGDIAKFGDKQQDELTQNLMVALKLKANEIQATRHTDDWGAANTGALGHGKIYHPTKVTLNYKFEGKESIELSYRLEQDVAAGIFKPLKDFPLIRLEGEPACLLRTGRATAAGGGGAGLYQEWGYTRQAHTSTLLQRGLSPQKEWPYMHTFSLSMHVCLKGSVHMCTCSGGDLLHAGTDRCTDPHAF